MNIEINVEDYLSPEDIRACAKQAVIEQVKSVYSRESDVQRLISNLSYQDLFAQIEEIMGEGDIKPILIEKIRGIIDNFHSYEVFREADAWGGKQSIGSRILHEEIEASRPRIRARIDQIIEEYPFRELNRDAIGEQVYDCIMDQLFGARSGVANA